MVFLKKQNDVDTKEMYINKGGENMRRENGITLIALIITIIILVILAAVSVSAVLNMKIVDYAVSGSQGYAQAGKDEEKMLDETSNKLDDTVTKIKNIQGSTSSKDESTKVEAFLNSEDFGLPTDGVWTLSDGTKLAYLGPDFSDESGASIYCLYNNVVYKAVRTEATEATGALTEVTSVEVASVNGPVLLATEPTYEYKVTKTNIDASKLGTYNSGKITLAAGEFVCEVTDDGYVVNGFLYSNKGVCLGNASREDASAK